MKLGKIRATDAKPEGFTLVEIMIVVAIIGILASVGMTQYQSYRMKGFNAAAISDLKNFKTAMESYYSEHDYYP